MRAARLGSGVWDRLAGQEKVRGMRFMGMTPGDEGGNAFVRRSMPRRARIKVCVQRPHRIKVNVRNTAIRE